MDTPAEVKPTPTRPRRRPLLGVAVALLTTVVYAPVHLFAFLLFMFSAERYDSSGSGGPFRSCTDTSLTCSGPDYAFMILCALVIAGGLLLAGFLGARAGGLTHRRGTGSRRAE